MAHEIFEKMVYSFNEVPWHKLGIVSQSDMFAEEMMVKHFGGGFNIEIKPSYTQLGGALKEDGFYTIVRGAYNEASEKVIGKCTERFHPLQPIEFCKLFDEKVQQFVETFAVLSDGKQIFISWVLPVSDIVAGEQVKMYGISVIGFDTTVAAKIYTSMYRPVCANTVAMAENWARNNTDGHGKGMVWTGKASNKNLARDLGAWMEHVQVSAIRQTELISELFGSLAKKPLTSRSEVKDLIYRAYPDKDNVPEYYPSALREEAQSKIDAKNQSVEATREGIYRLFDGEGTAIDATGWGLFNATTEYFCHYMPSKKPPYESILFGGRHDSMMSMASVLQNWVTR